MTDDQRTSGAGLGAVTIQQEDADVGVRVVLGEGRAVLDVQLDRDRVPRTPAELAASVLAAFERADAERLGHVAEESGDPEAWWREQAARRPATRRADTSRAAHLARGGRHRERGSRRTERVSISSNGFVTMTWGASGLLRTVEADGSWLAAATPERVEAALREAGRWEGGVA